MRYEELRRMKKDLRSGLVEFMATKDPGKSVSTYSTYVSDSNYLLNNDQEDAFIRFVRLDDDNPEIKDLICKLLVEHRGEVKGKAAVDYYYEKLCWQREYIKQVGGIDTFFQK